MSRENADVVRDSYAAINERDFDRLTSLYAEDIELVVHVQGIRGGAFKGRDAAGAWLGDWLSTFGRDAHFEITELSELEDGSVLVVADHHARGRASGVEVHGTVVWLYRVNDGRITHVEGYPSRDEALAAVGLSE